MKTKQLILVTVTGLLAAGNAQFSNAHAQGSLTPPGPPGPTMVTLSQVEPRTPICSAPYTISQPGSYYLTANLTVSYGNAITITASGVTLDLRGFTISSTAASADGTAISLFDSLTNIAIFNGSIISGVTTNGNGGYNGGGFLYGIDAFFAPPINCWVKNISVNGVLDTGIFLGTDNSTLVESCVVNLAGGAGIVAGTVSDSAALNAGGDGIYCNTAINCYGSTMGNIGDSPTGIEAYSVENCCGFGNYVESGGIQADNAQNCYGYNAGYGAGIQANTAENCYGVNNTGPGQGINSFAADNCYGVCNGSGTALTVNDGVANSCYAYSSSGTGLYAAVANACIGYSGSGTGLNATIANVCSGQSSGSGTGLTATNAIGCFGQSVSGTGLYAFIASVSHGASTSGTPLTAAHNVNSY